MLSWLHRCYNAAASFLNGVRPTLMTPTSGQLSRFLPGVVVLSQQASS